MPIITLNLDPHRGPLVSAAVAVSQPHRDALIAAGKPIPTATWGTFLIDTGASNTSIDPSLIDPLDLEPTGAIMVHTPSTAGVPLSMAQYDVSFLIPCGEAETPLFVPAIGISTALFKAQGIDGLIGRDILDQCLLTYNGRIGSFSLAY